jgi:hypothetical protein
VKKGKQYFFTKNYELWKLASINFCCSLMFACAPCSFPLAVVVEDYSSQTRMMDSMHGCIARNEEHVKDTQDNCAQKYAT